MKMKKYLTSFLLMIGFSISLNVSAFVPQKTSQLLYKNKTLYLDIGWGCPTPLASYFYQRQEKFPFKVFQKARNSYRKEVASWVVINDSLFLKSIADTELATPKLPVDYGLQGHKSSYGEIYADWFSGILLAKKGTANISNQNEHYYFHVRKGKILQVETIDNHDRNHIKTKQFNLLTKDKKKMLVLYQNYITYFFRLGTEAVDYQNETCLLYTGVSELSPFYDLYDNSHLNWPYNWENIKYSGAPNAQWQIKKGKIYLKNVTLHQGLALDHIEKRSLNLEKLLDKPVLENGVFADWINGIYQINHGILTDENFVTTHFSFLRIENGKLIEAFKVDRDFNFDKIRRKTDPKLKVILKEYQKRFED